MDLFSAHHWSNPAAVQDTIVSDKIKNSSAVPLTAVTTDSYHE